MLYDIGTIRSRFKFLVFTIVTPASDDLAELIQFDFIACIQLFSYLLFFLRTIFSLWSSEWQWLMNFEWTIWEHKLNARWANGERLMNGKRERFVNGERTVSDARLNARRSNVNFLENVPSKWKLLYIYALSNEVKLIHIPSNEDFNIRTHTANWESVCLKFSNQSPLPIASWVHNWKTH